MLDKNIMLENYVIFFIKIHIDTLDFILFEFEGNVSRKEKLN